MLVAKTPFDIPLNFARDVLFNWPNHKFFLDAFNLIDAFIVKQEENVTYFFAHTKEFIFLPLFIAGKTTKRRISVDFEFSVQSKKHSDYFSIIDNADKGLYFFTFVFEENNLVLKELESTSSNVETIEKALEITSLGIEIQYYIQLAESMGNLDEPFEYKSKYSNEGKKNPFKEVNPKENKSLKQNENYKAASTDYLFGPDYIISAFRLLELNPTRNVKVIRTNYRRLAREKHPDRVRDPKLKGYAGREFVELSTAYQTILKWLEN